MTQGTLEIRDDSTGGSLYHPFSLPALRLSAASFQSSPLSDMRFEQIWPLPSEPVIGGIEMRQHRTVRITVNLVIAELQIREVN